MRIGFSNNETLRYKNLSMGSGSSENTSYLSQVVANDFLDKKEQNVELSQKKYRDPLLKWPLRGLAFTNDIGAAVMDIAPTLGMLLWVPALMYFGADIYDKYKTDEREYSPDGKRAFKQAVFQACASVMCPIIVVHNGQKAASLLGKKSKNNLSLQMQEEVDNFTVFMLKRRSLKKYENNITGFKNEFNEQLKTHLIDMHNEINTKNPFKLVMRWVFGSKHGEKFDDERFKLVQEYSDKNIDEMFAIRKDLLDKKRPDGLSNKLMNLYDKTRKNFAKDKNTIEGHVEDSIKDVLKQRQRDKLFKTKLGKTIGGFIALGVSIQFIDKFVEKYIIEKLVEPGLDNINMKK